MPSISKIRLTNVQYEQGNKRYNDELFFFDGHNTAILLENGGGKTVLIQSVIQAVVPNGVMAGRKIRDTLDITSSPAHIAVEWIQRDKPRRYALTCITFFMGRDGVEYMLYAYDYPEGDQGSIEHLPFVRETRSGRRPATREEMKEYYQKMASSSMNAKTFATRESYQSYLEEQFQIMASEWEAILKINSTEGGVESFFDGCKTTGQLVDRLLIPVVEQGMAGQGSKEFARIFDNHRHHFREYLALNEQIKEYQQVGQRIGQVIGRYAAINQQEEAYRRIKGRAKGLYQYLENELAAVGADFAELQEAKNNLQRSREMWHRKKLSLEIAGLRRKLDKQQAELNKLEADKEDKEKTHRDYHSRIESLRLAGLQSELKLKEETRTYLHQELAGLDSSPDIERLGRELELVLAHLRYHYDQQEGYLLQQKNEGEKSLAAAGLQMKAAGRRLKQLGSELKALEIKVAETARDINNAKLQMYDLEQDILDDPSREQVLDQMPLWQRRSGEIAADLTELYRQITRSREVKKDLWEQQRRLKNSLPGIQDKITSAKSKIGEIEEKQTELLGRLTALSPGDQDIQSLYLRQQTLAQRLEEELAGIEIKRDSLLARERTLLRLYDLYRENKIFTADPALEKWVHKWQQDFPSLQLGASFVEMYLEENPGLKMEDIYRHYPLWPVSLVSGKNDLPGIRKHLEKQAAEWTHPVFILSEQEALLALQNDGTDAGRPVIPSSWPEISSRESFQDWLDAQKQMAGEVIAERKFWDDRWQRWKALAREIKRFWEIYDHQQVYLPLKEELERARKEFQQNQRDSASTELKLKEIELQMEEEEKKKLNLEQEQTDLSNRHRLGLKWQVIYEKKLQYTLLQEQLQPQIEKVKNEINTVEEQQAGLGKQMEQWQAGLQETRFRLATLQAGDKYRRTRESQGIASNESFELLKEKHSALEEKLSGLQGSRREIERQLAGTEKEIDSLVRKINNQLTEYKDIIVAMEFSPPGGEEEINRLTRLKMQAQKQLRELGVSFTSLRDSVRDLKTVIGLKEKDYPGLPAEIISFDGQPLTRVEAELQAEEKKLAAGGKQLEQREADLNRLNGELLLVQQELKIAHGVHQFIIEEIEAMDPSLQDKREYPYQRLNFTRVLVKKLDAARDNVQQHQKEVDSERKHFENYCRQEIRHEKTKQQALNGILVKNTFTEIKEWGEHLQERIRAALNIAEQDLRTLDTEVQHFINQLHDHLKHICEELLTIPKMTAVRIAEARKEIFNFTVPSWPDHEGKAKLRRHLEWMLKELEKDKFLTDLGFEDTPKIIKQIESWLHPKQLLQVIDSSQEIKVRCRKVTRETHVTTTFTDWAKAENWSGGEKWSKNMTLFLGILNYLAEKRQHIRREATNHRVVIMDNPFGKASSDHVLGPVFFIAGQLGFQLIALTALSEGKFLRDHFPIIYSCRLRSTSDPSIAVMTKEKEIRQAFFQDADPYTIQRLGEMENDQLIKLSIN